MCHPLVNRRVALLLYRDHVAWVFSLDNGCCRRHLFRCDRWTEQLYSLGNAVVETSWHWGFIRNCHGACCRYSTELDVGLAYLGLLFPAVQSTWANLSAVYSVVVLLSIIVYFYRWLAKICPFQRRASTLSLVKEKTQSCHTPGLSFLLSFSSCSMKG